jgi:hypothetical protein
MRRLAVLGLLLLPLPAVAQIGAGAPSDLPRAGLAGEAPGAKRVAPDGFTVRELPAPEPATAKVADAPMQQAESKSEARGPRAADRPCQDVPVLVRIGGQTTQAYARMCQGDDGSWSLAK